jgi:hypothetical protein
MWTLGQEDLLRILLWCLTISLTLSLKCPAGIIWNFSITKKGRLLLYPEGRFESTINADDGPQWSNHLG